jgi:hypothetical protein
MKAKNEFLDLLEFESGDIESLKKRFWSNVDKTPGVGPFGDCWLWKKSCNRGYGIIGLPRNGRTVRVNRLSWILTNGPLFPGSHVLHRCDVTRCVNPGHLFVGDQISNMADMNSKGRGNQGERNPQSVLTWERVLKIRTDAGESSDYASIAEKEGVSKYTIRDILKGKTWRENK